MTEAEWDKAWAINTKAHLHLLRAALPHFTTANPEGGVFLTTASTAGVSTSGSSMAYSVSKAAGLHLVKCLAATQGPKIRCNAVLPGLLLTEWGDQFGQERIEAVKGVSYLKKEVRLPKRTTFFPTLSTSTSSVTRLTHHHRPTSRTQPTCL